MWYDRTGVAPGASNSGCYKMAGGGKRYRRGDWPSVELDTLKNTSADECNVYDQTQFINNRTPRGG